MRPIIKRIDIKLVNGKLEKGEVTTVQSDVDVLDLEGVDYKLPLSSSTGDTLTGEFY
jgi:hypothetical protein